MNTLLADEIRVCIKKELQALARKKGVMLQEINNDLNMLETGAVDSLGFLELLVGIEKRFDIKIDFSNLDPSEFTSLNKLSTQCARLAEGRNSGR